MVVGQKFMLYDIRYLMRFLVKDLRIPKRNTKALSETTYMLYHNSVCSFIIQSFSKLHRCEVLNHNFRNEGLGIRKVMNHCSVV